MGLGKAKEGLSMFAVLNQCVSTPGRQLLRLWLARPLVDLPVITARQVTTQHITGEALWWLAANMGFEHAAGDGQRR